MDSFVQSGALRATINNVQLIELNTMRPLLPHALDQVRSSVYFSFFVIDFFFIIDRYIAWKYQRRILLAVDNPTHQFWMPQTFDLINIAHQTCDLAVFQASHTQINMLEILLLFYCFELSHNIKHFGQNLYRKK